MSAAALATEVSSFQASPAEKEMAAVQAELAEVESVRTQLDKQRQDHSEQIQTLREQKNKPVQITIVCVVSSKP